VDPHPSARPSAASGPKILAALGIKTGIPLPGWRLRCRSCGKEWIFEASYRISDFESLYHYCRYCKKNTFHEIIEKIG